MLRRIEEKDLGALFDFRNDPEIYKWCRQNAPLHWANHKAWFEKQAKDSTVSMFSIVEHTYMGEWTAVGVCGLTDIDYVNRRAEFSLYIGKDYQGSGRGERALKELLYYGFYALGLNTIWGETFDGNPALNLFSKIGMQLEGTRHGFYFRNGHFIDAHLIAIDRERFDSYFYSHPLKEVPTTGPTA